MADEKTGGQSALENQWRELRPILEAEFGKAEFQHWVAPLGFVGLQGTCVTLGVSSPFMRDWVSRNYADRILSHWHKINPDVQDVRIALLRTGEEESAHTSAKHAHVRPSDAPKGDTAGRKVREPCMSFANFLVGSSNRLAYTAALNLAECKPAPHKPLYLYGGVGMGKTHLLCAIAKSAREKRPSLHIQHLNGEQFMMQMAQAFESRKALEFKTHLRTAELLLIDDMHFLTGARMQNEMQHTLDFLLAEDCGVVLAAVKSPGKLSMNDSLRSRLAGGLSIEIQPADAELRLDILHRKASVLLPQPLSPEVGEVLVFLAENHRGGMREMEGVLRNILNTASVLKQKITLRLAQDALREVLQTCQRYLAIEDIQHRVCRYYGVRISELNSRRRTHVITRPRHIAMYLSKRMTSSSFPEIGRKFGGRDHATVVHAVRRIETLRRENPKLDAEVTLLETDLNP